MWLAGPYNVILISAIVPLVLSRPETGTVAEEVYHSDLEKRISTTKLTESELNNALVGYDLVHGEPYALSSVSMDPGLKHQIFKKDGVQPFSKLVCNGQLDEKVITTVNEFRKYSGSETVTGSGFGFEQKGSVSVSDPSGTVSASQDVEVSADIAFSDSKSTSEVTQFLKKEKGAVCLIQAACKTYEVKLSTYNLPKYTDTFKEAIKDLASKTQAKEKQNDAFKRFVQEFGTHYMNKVTLGARMMYTTLINQAGRNKFDEKTMKECSKSSMNMNLFGLKASHSSSECSTENQKTFSSENKYVKATMSRSFGSKPSNSLSEWSQQEFVSLPMEIELRPIDELLDQTQLNKQELSDVNGGDLLSWFRPLYHDYCKTMNVACGKQKKIGCGYTDNCKLHQRCIDVDGKGKTKCESIIKTYGGNGAGESCHFPFVHSGTTYNHCTRQGRDNLWCGTDENANKWGYCKINGAWRSWGNWGSCSPSCGNSRHQNRYRQCSGTGCSGDTKMTKRCASTRCRPAGLPASTCPNFEAGEGTGGSEVKVSSISHGDSCIYHCMWRKKTDSRINGVSYGIGGTSGCWCERDMKQVSRSSDSTSRYKTCAFSAASLRCSGIDGGCCTPSNPCGEGDGDCDSDADCAGSLVCGRKNCPWGDNDDCCMKFPKGAIQMRSDWKCGPKNLINGFPGQCDPKRGAPCCSSLGWCGSSDGHCKCESCKDFRKRGLGAYTCPSFESGDGIGGSDIQISGGLHAYQGMQCVLACMARKRSDPRINGATYGKVWYKRGCWCERNMKSVSKISYVTTRYNTCAFSAASLRCSGIDGGCCTPSNPCGEGDGDCDSDADCAGSLVCGSNNCPWGDNDDCCM